MTLLHLLGLPPRIQSRYLSGIKQSTPDLIMHAVTGYTGIGSEAIIGKSRLAHIVEARHIAICLMRKSAGMTLQSIGKRFRRDHSTIIHSLDRSEAMIETDKDFRNKYEQIVQGL